jgi:hypothetical protein
MMAVARRPAKRLLILPALLLAVLVVALHVTRDVTPREVDPDLQVAGLPPLAGDALDCERPADAERVAEIRTGLDPNGRVSSVMVLACPVAYDGLYLRYVGELVGDLLRRDGGAWVMVNDDAYAFEVGPLGAHADPRGTNSGLTVWLPDELLTDVSGLGQPGQRGDVVEIRGHIVRTDPEDGGGLTFRAEQVAILAAAATVEAPLERVQVILAATSLAAGGLLWVIRRRGERV